MVRHVFFAVFKFCWSTGWYELAVAGACVPVQRGYLIPVVMCRGCKRDVWCDGSVERYVEVNAWW